MSKKRKIRAFIKKYSPVKLKVVFEDFGSNDLYSGYAFLEENVILLNTRTIDQKPLFKIKELALHEIGHFAIPYTGITKIDEYNAQTWALKTAIKYKLKKIVQENVKEFLSWGQTTWNERKGKYRRYLLAYKIFNRNKKKLLKDAKHLL